MNVSLELNFVEQEAEVKKKEEKKKKEQTQEGAVSLLYLLCFVNVLFGLNRAMNVLSISFKSSLVHLVWLLDYTLLFCSQ